MPKVETGTLQEPVSKLTKELSALWMVDTNRCMKSLPKYPTRYFTAFPLVYIFTRSNDGTNFTGDASLAEQ